MRLGESGTKLLGLTWLDQYCVTYCHVSSSSTAITTTQKHFTLSHFLVQFHYIALYLFLSLCISTRHFPHSLVTQRIKKPV
ncbi:hypothetical protein PIB30_029699 [Stylosanthes scabra]|uniref:Uncharacterized protein n=1 Tax=Stylosanthes scabra TaxID=79078 RepID=A0ABU6V9G0_9FABA|nr:hypothetical protein [Stylosanthes scabra]